MSIDVHGALVGLALWTWLDLSENWDNKRYDSSVLPPTYWWMPGCPFDREAKATGVPRPTGLDIALSLFCSVKTWKEVRKPSGRTQRSYGAQEPLMVAKMDTSLIRMSRSRCVLRSAIDRVSQTGGPDEGKTEGPKRREAVPNHKIWNWWGQDRMWCTVH